MDRRSIKNLIFLTYANTKFKSFVVVKIATYFQSYANKNAYQSKIQNIWNFSISTIRKMSYEKSLSIKSILIIEESLFSRNKFKWRFNWPKKHWETSRRICFEGSIPFSMKQSKAKIPFRLLIVSTNFSTSIFKHLHVMKYIPSSISSQLLTLIFLKEWQKYKILQNRKLSNLIRH